jgi:hypothetical protein
MEENLQEQVEQVTQPEEVAPQDVNTQQPAEASTQNQYEYNAEEKNLVRMRELKEQAEREKAELQAKLREYEQPQQRPQEQQEEIDYGDSDFVEGRVLKKEITGLKKQLEAFHKQQVQMTDEDKLRRQYSDFDQVVNPEKMRILKEKDPEMADTIARSQASLYSRGTAAYKRIKELTHHVTDVHAQDRAKAHDNMSKPRPVNSVSPQSGDSPLSMANAFGGELSPEAKAHYWKQTQKAIKKL